MTEYLKANENDFCDLVDLINYVFSAYQPHDFEKLLPAQYARTNFMAGTNYVAKEDGKIVANVGAYPAVYNVCGEEIAITGITSVAVHPRARSKGYMRKLMDMALEDMRKDGAALSFLMGRRQRYEYFGYTPCGVRFNYYCNTDNIRHHFKKDINPEIMLKEIHSGDKELINDVFHRHHTGNAYVKRPYERFADIMASWEDRTVAVYHKSSMAGYLSVTKDYGTVCEINLDNPALLGEILGVYLKQYKRSDISIEAYPAETAVAAELSKLTEAVTINHCVNFNVMDYPAVLNAFLKLKCETEVLPSGALTIGIQNVGNITISVSGNCPSVCLTNHKPDVECTRIDAMRLLFSPGSAFALGALTGNAFTRCLLPVPLFIKKNDLS
jgi:predicted N-acetyltransferase YhbS